MSLPYVVPTFADQQTLPLVTAFALEALRWRPVNVGGTLASLTTLNASRLMPNQQGVAHRATKDIVWNNYVIPEGATVIGNHW